MLFNSLHLSYDRTLNAAVSDQSRNLKIHNAQFFSRLGFVAEDMKNKEREVIDVIRDRGIQIGDTNAQCILDGV